MGWVKKHKSDCCYGWCMVMKKSTGQSHFVQVALLLLVIPLEAAIYSLKLQVAIYSPKLQVTNQIILSDSIQKRMPDVKWKKLSKNSLCCESFAGRWPCIAALPCQRLSWELIVWNKLQYDSAPSADCLKQLTQVAIWPPSTPCWLTTHCQDMRPISPPSLFRNKNQLTFSSALLVLLAIILSKHFLYMSAPSFELC